MWRSIFIALGLMAIIVGFECLMIDSATVYSGKATPASFMNPSMTPTPNVREVRPKEWFPWAVLAGGTVTVLYAFTIPGRFRRVATE